jgi:hypothetical protein
MLNGKIEHRIASLYNDLESLYLVAVCSYIGEVKWANSHNAHRYFDCSKASGIHSTNFEPFVCEWFFLNGVLACLNANSSVEELVCAFTI